MPKHYANATSFRRALEDRIKRRARPTTKERDILHGRRQVAFERLLARPFSITDPPWLLKGGYAMEIRLDGHARMTQDVDLSIPLSRDSVIQAGTEQTYAIIHQHLKSAVNQNLDDWFVYDVAPAMQELAGAPYGGARFLVDAQLDGRNFAKFHLDVGLGDAVVAAPEWLMGLDLLAFAGIASGRFAAIAREQQFAEKIHAYTQPRGDRENTRVKDLIDLVLLIQLGLPEVDQVAHALSATFDQREGHQQPQSLDPPPSDWAEPYAEMAEECGLDLTTPEAAYAFVITYWDTLPR